MKIYADMIFLINAFMDFFIFWIVSRLVKKKIPCFRMVLGSGMASLCYCFLLFVPWLRSFYNFFGSLVILFFSVWFIFRPHQWTEMLLLLVFSHIAAFAVGGVGIVLFFFTNTYGWIGNGLTFSIGNFSVKILFASTASIYIILKLISGWLHTNFVQRQDFCKIKISLDCSYVELTALIDTGHCLYDTVSGMPVIIVEFSSVRKLFPLEMQIAFYESESMTKEAIQKALGQNPLKERLRMIPFSSLGAEKAMMPGFLVDSAEIMKEEKAPIQRKPAVIGIIKQPLCKGKGYHGLVSTDLFWQKGEMLF